MASIGQELKAQTIYTDGKVLSEHSPLTYHSHESMNFNPQFFKGLLKEYDISIQDKMELAFADEKKVLTILSKETEKGEREFYFALVTEKEDSKLSSEGKGYLYYPYKHFEVLAEMPVDSAKVSQKFYREIYMRGFLNYLNDYEKRPKEQLQNYYRGKLYLMEPETIFFEVNQLEDAFKNEALLTQVLPNAKIYGEKKGKKNDTELEADRTQPQEDKSAMKKRMEKEAMVKKEAQVKKKTKRENDAGDMSPEEKAKLLGDVPLAFLEGENMALAEVIPFTRDGKAWIQKYFLSKEHGLIYSAQRPLDQRKKESAKWSRPDLSPFKVKPSAEEKQGIKTGKIK